MRLNLKNIAINNNDIVLNTTLGPYVAYTPTNFNPTECAEFNLFDETNQLQYTNICNLQKITAVSYELKADNRIQDGKVKTYVDGYINSFQHKGSLCMLSNEHQSDIHVSDSWPTPNVLSGISYDNGVSGELWYTDAEIQHDVAIPDAVALFPNNSEDSTQTPEPAVLITDFPRNTIIEIPNSTTYNFLQWDNDKLYINPIDTRNYLGKDWGLDNAAKKTQLEHCRKYVGGGSDNRNIYLRYKHNVKYDIQVATNDKVWNGKTTTLDSTQWNKPTLLSCGCRDIEYKPFITATIGNSGAEACTDNWCNYEYLERIANRVTFDAHAKPSNLIKVIIRNSGILSSDTISDEQKQFLITSINNSLRSVLANNLPATTELLTISWEGF